MCAPAMRISALLPWLHHCGQHVACHHRLHVRDGRRRVAFRAVSALAGGNASMAIAGGEPRAVAFFPMRGDAVGCPSETAWAAAAHGER